MFFDILFKIWEFSFLGRRSGGHFIPPYVSCKYFLYWSVHVPARQVVLTGINGNTVTVYTQQAFISRTVNRCSCLAILLSDKL